jgi:hypothetical protein
MMHKTKAALQSCQCHYGISKQSQHTRVNAGGQRMSRLNIEYADFIQLLCRNSKISIVPNPLIIATILTFKGQDSESYPLLYAFPTQLPD